jgi:hypothetical protein
MFVLVHHTVTDPDTFWPTAQAALSDMPAGLTLHHCLAGKDGVRATCLWEAESVEAVRSFLEPVIGPSSRNEYSEAENRDGIAVPAHLVMEPPTP